MRLSNKPASILRNPSLALRLPLLGTLILVSRKRLSLADNITKNNVTYEYRNVAVEPDAPSIEARKTDGRDLLA